MEDKSSRPEKLRISLTREQEDLILFERKKLKKSIEEIYLTLEGVIPNLYPVKIFRCLVRYGLSTLPEELVKAERQIKRFRKYSIGFLHIDTLYTPKIDKKRWYVFTAIDRVSKIAFIQIRSRKTKEMGARFLKSVLVFYPYPWTNGMVERFNAKIKKNVIRRYLFENEEDLKLTLICYLNKYNFEVKLKQFKTN